jgi:hypothetical protein
MPTRIIAACFALSAFALATVLGMAAGNDAVTTLWRALLAMAAAYFVGSIIGHVARIAVQEHVARYKAEHPIPTSDDLNESQQATDSVETESAAAENAAVQPQDAPGATDRATAASAA